MKFRKTKAPQFRKLGEKEISRRFPVFLNGKRAKSDLVTKAKITFGFQAP
jgi:hypothetical protein